MTERNGGRGALPLPASHNSIVEVPSQKIAYLDNNGMVSTLARISSGRVKHITKQWLTAWLPGCSAAWTAVRGLRGRLELVATLLFVRRGVGGRREVQERARIIISLLIAPCRGESNPDCDPGIQESGA